MKDSWVQLSFRMTKMTSPPFFVAGGRVTMTTSTILLTFINSGVWDGKPTGASNIMFQFNAHSKQSPFRDIIHFKGCLEYLATKGHVTMTRANGLTLYGKALST